MRIAVLKEEKRLLGLQLQQARTTLAEKEKESVREKEFHTMQDTHVLEKEIKTVFLSASQPTSKPIAEVPTRSVGVGDSDIFDPSFNVHVHEKELRTVFVGGNAASKPAQRNVGILCKAAVRDVGVVYRWEEEKPLMHHVSVGVNEIGFDLVDGTSATQTSVHNVHSLINQLNMASFQTRHIHIEKDLLRQVIEEKISKKVASVGIMCKFSTEARSTQCDTNNDCENKKSRDFGCGEFLTEMKYSPLTKSVGKLKVLQLLALY